MVPLMLSESNRILNRSYYGFTGRIVCVYVCKVTEVIKLALEAGKAPPTPQVSPALGSKGVNIMKDYNARTADKAGYIISTEITVYDMDFFFHFISPF
ncbi:hypothetical protein R6Q57_008888 [Mikania cordata]